MKVSEYAATWLVEHPRPSDTTNKQCGYGIRQFLAAFGHRRLDGLEFAEARKWAEKHRSSAKYARAMYEDARRDGKVNGNNPFANMRLPVERGRADITVIDAGELEALEVAGAAVNLRGAIRFAAYTGLRLGELLALEQGDVDPVAGEASIDRSLRPDGVTAKVKSRRRRTIVVPELAWMSGAGYPTPRLFPFTRAQHRALWDQTRELADVKIAWHELRHFAATWMLEKCRDYELVAAQLGHSSSEVTRRIYVHPDEATERRRFADALR